MSLEDLLREEVQKLVDIAIKNIPWDMTKFSTQKAKSTFQFKDISDFVYGFEYGSIVSDSISYYQNKIVGGLVTKEKLEQAITIINSILSDRIPEIRQAISRIV
jgi:hypothetical protein